MLSCFWLYPATAIPWRKTAAGLDSGILPLKSLLGAGWGAGHWSNAQSRANYSSFWRQDPSIYSIQCPVNHGENKPIYPALYEYQGLLPQILSYSSFPNSELFLPTYVLISSKLNTQQWAPAGLSSLCGVFLFPIPCLVHFSCHSLPGFLPLSL